MSYIKRYIDELMELGIDVLHDGLEEHDIMLDIMYEYYELKEEKQGLKDLQTQVRPGSKEHRELAEEIEKIEKKQIKKNKSYE